MSFFTDLPIRKKLLAGFGAMLALTAALGLFSIETMESMNSSALKLHQSLVTALPIANLSSDAEALVQLCAETHLMVDPDQIKNIPNAAAQRQQLLAQETTLEQDFATAWANYAPSMDPGRETNDGQAINAAFNAIAQDAAQENTADQGTDNSVGAQLLLVSIQQQLAALRAVVQDDNAYQKVQNQGLSDNAAQTASSGILYSEVLLGIILLGTVITALVISNSIAGPINALSGVMQKLAGGDFSVKIPELGRRDEIGVMAKTVQSFKEAGVKKRELEAEAAAFQKNLDRQIEEVRAAAAAANEEQKTVTDLLAAALAKIAQGDLTVRITQQVSGAYDAVKRDFNTALESFQKTLSAISSNTAGVRSGASEITAASDDLSRRTEQQAASLEETAAALDEITATVKRTAEGANEARNLVSSAKADAERSGAVVSETVAAVSGIEQSSKQIGNIIGVIDEIAFQTNLLALNAGVEAARAGDAGRGFAVVATEVRALAQRSADAAKEIKTLISSSGKQVEAGVKLVGETGKALSRIVEQVNQLNTLVTEIANSAQEQASGLAEVNTAMNQMDQVTQQNAAMVEESTAASHSLAGEAAELARLVGQFNLGDQPAHAAPPPALRRAAAPAPVVKKSRIPVHAPINKPVAAAAPSGGGENWDEF